MRRKKAAKRGPSFFKVLVRPDFTRLLRLPPLFMQKHGSILQKNVKLRVLESGRTWDVKMEAMEDGMFCFSKGWSNFAQDVGLKFGEFLVFVLDNGGFSVDVSVYETTGCRKEFPAVCTVERKPVLQKMSNYEATGSKNEFPAVCTVERKPDLLKMSSPLYYETVLKQHHKSRVTLRRTLSRAACLLGKKRVEVVGEHCNRWVTLDCSHRYDAQRVDMTHGWATFRTENGLVYGKKYSFEFKPAQNVIQVKQVKKINGAF